MQTPEPIRDPVRLEIYRHLLTALAEEMGATLRRSAYSPNIKERRDYSCALFDAAGDPVAMGDHMPVHLGAMPMSVRAALAELGTLDPGDVAALNDPFRGGTHLPDITLVAPVYIPDDDAPVDDAAGLPATTAPIAYVAARAHHADVGGMAAGSMPLATEIYQEGLRIPPVRLMAGGRRVDDVWRMLLANVRTPGEREGDLDAQLAALVAGRRRLEELAARRGTTELRAAMAGLLDYADRLLRAGIARIPDGVYEAEDFMEDDGVADRDGAATPLPIRLRLTVSSDTVEADFTGTAPQARGGINAVEAITASATRYALRVVVERLLGQPLPAGGGAMSALTLTVPPGTLVSARPPASVAGGNVETSQRVTDVLLLALSQAVPDIAAAQSQGTMNNLTVGGIDPRTGRPFAYYETMAGGMGGGADGPGLSAVHVHMTNSLNTPVEALEHAYPFRVLAYAIRRGTGGAGQHPGGDGLRRDLRLLADGDISLLTERRRVPPRGLAGGEDGAPGANILIRDGREQALPTKTTRPVRAGDVLSIRSPGGGGWGPAAGD